MRRRAPRLVFAALLLLAPAAARAGDSLGPRARRAIENALARIDLAGDDLRVRDFSMWRKNAARLRAAGRMTGSCPLPRLGDVLRPPLVDRARLRPLDAVSLGIDLLERRYPPPLDALLAEPPAGPGRSPIVALLALARALADLEDRARAVLPPRLVGGRLARFMVEEIADYETEEARTIFDALGAADLDGLVAAARRVAAQAARVRPAAGDWPWPAPLRIPTTRGIVVLGTPGPDVHEADAWLLVDPGGDDVYRNNAGGARRGAALLVDVAGNDRYETTDDFAQGSALLGVGILVDLAGNDVYRGRDFCQAAAVGGAGVLLDLGGEDEFVADRFGQGAAAFGAGILESRGPEKDRYRVELYGQGLGRTAGWGLLVEEGGDDRYEAGGKYESATYSQWTGGRTIHWSRAQGCGFGFYCRYEDGDDLVIREMFPGGVGLLLDDAGDDVYRGSMYAQGTAYFYALGILVDRAGDDDYTATWYGQGAAPHFATGILVDGDGDDDYLGMHQVQGNGRDFSVGVHLDVGGDDVYSAEDRVQGCGDLSDGYGIFVDFAGNDRYDAARPTARGYATEKRPERQPTAERPYRDVGVFLDLGGRDTYSGPAGGKDGTTWIREDTRRGVGVDRP